ncbi:MAG: hypothetical protein ACR2M1_08395 [Gemmatimonadaceae bacterium]
MSDQITTTSSPEQAIAPVVSAFRAAYAAGKEMPRAGVAVPASWTEDARELFDERAGFLEYAGGHLRDEAEHLAVTDVCLALGVAGIEHRQVKGKISAGEDDGLTDLFGAPTPRTSINAITAGH